MRVFYIVVTLFGVLVLGGVSLHTWPKDMGPDAYVWASVVMATTLASLWALIIEHRRPMPPVSVPGDCVRGAYFPANNQNCSPDTERYLNHVMTWEAVAKAEDGPFSGVWLMKPRGESNPEILVPLSDLLIQERRRKH